MGAIWVLLAAALAVGWRRPSLVLAVVAAVAGADLAATSLKLLSGRQRPYVHEPEPAPLVGTYLDLTLPSGHAATSFAAALVLAAAVRRWWATAVLFVLAAAVAWSRVYVGVHYPSDVAAGALVGLGVGALTLIALPRLGPRLRSLRTPGADPRRSRRAPPPG